MDKYLELAIYRTVQELLINIVKHARAKTATVVIKVDNQDIVIKVADDGIGLVTNKKDKSGIGLASIRSKINLLNSRTTIKSAPNKGTSVEITIPRPEIR